MDKNISDTVMNRSINDSVSADGSWRCCKCKHENYHETFYCNARIMSDAVIVRI